MTSARIELARAPHPHEGGPYERGRRRTTIQRRRENRFFLDRAIARGDQFVLSDRPCRARPGPSFDRELRYLNAGGTPVRKPIDAHLL